MIFAQLDFKGLQKIISPKFWKHRYNLQGSFQNFPYTETLGEINFYFSTLMKKIINTLFLFTFQFSIFLFINDVEAKRMAPSEVDPLIYAGLKFTAPHEHMGYIEVWDNNTGKKLWEKQVYKVNIDPSLEADVQWIFITKLEMENGKLAVTNEGGDKYLVDIKQKEVESNIIPTDQETLATPQTNASIKMYALLGVIFVSLLVLSVYFIRRKK